MITLELHDLELVGHGMLKDPESGHLEVIEFNGPIKTGNILIQPEEELNAEGNMYPRFTIIDVDFVLDHNNVIVTCHGQTPLFKSLKFETAMKKYLKSEFNNVRNTIKLQLSIVEKNIWKNIPFEYRGLGYYFLYSLSDKLILTSEYLELGILSEIYGADHGEFKESLRRIVPQFRDDQEFI